MQVWLQVFPQVLTGVLIFHIMMIGLLAIKESYATIIVSPPRCMPFAEATYRAVSFLWNDRTA